MSLTLTTAAKNASTDAVVDRIDVGGGANGTIDWQTSADANVVTTQLQATAFGASSNGTAALAGVPLTSSPSSGTATIAKALFKNKNGVEEFRVTVAASGADINTGSTPTLNAGETIRLDSFTITTA